MKSRQPKMLAMTDHRAWKLVRERVEAGYPMKAIAKELGVTVEHLCEWIMRYKEPRVAKQSVEVRRPAISHAPYSNSANHFNLSTNAQRYANWRKARDGARAARGEA